MKARRTLQSILFLTSIVFSSIFVSGQDIPAPTLIDEFPRVTCEELLARTDNFFIQMQNNPSMLGIVVLERPSIGQDFTPYQRKLITGTFQRYGVDLERLRFFRRSAEKQGGSMWLAYSGDAPIADAEPWPDAPLDLSKAFIWESVGDESPCPSFSPRAYANLVLTNSNIRGHIVVNATNRKEAITIGTYWIDELTKQWNVPRNRLKLIVGKRHKDWSYTDFWIVPIIE